MISTFLVMYDLECANSLVDLYIPRVSSGWLP